MTVLTLHEAFQALAQGATLVARSRRLSRSLRFSYNLRQQKDQKTVWETPDLLPFGAFLRRSYARLIDFADKPESLPVLLSPAQDAALWETVIRQSLLNNPDALLNPRAAARQARSARELLLDWAGDGAEIDWNATADTDAFHFWHTRYVDELKARRWIDEAGLPDRLLTAKTAAWAPVKQMLLLAGFDEYTPRERRLIAKLEAARVPVAEVRTRVRERADQEVLIRLRDSEDEIREAARWALELLERGERGSIAVVVPELSRLRTRVEHVFTDVLGSSGLFNLSLGRALSEYPVVAAALTALSLAENEVPIGAVGALLRSPFFEGAETELGARALADVELRRFGALSVSQRQIRKHAPPLFRAALSRFEKVTAGTPARQSPGAWAATFSRLLDALGWPGERTRTTEEFQAVAEWSELLSEFARVGVVIPSMDAGEAVRTLTGMAAETVWQPQAETAAAVQVLGLLETSGLDFAHLRVIGMHDGLWPAPPRPHPFIPYVVQRRLKMPHATNERELAFARVTTERLRAAAPNVVFSYPMWRADEELRPSALLAGIRGETLPYCRGSENRGAEMLRGSERLVGDAIEQLTDDRGPEFRGAIQRGGARVLQDMAACPFRAFAVHRLGAKALEDGTFGPDARDRGTLVHAALKNLGCERTPSRDQIEQAVTATIEAKREEMGIGPHLAMLERDRLTTLIERWFELEKSRPADYRIVSQEADRTVSIGGLELGVRMDRVDELSDGRQIILDYKTGEPKTKQWESDRPDDPQLMLYAITHDRPLAAIAFAQIRADGVKYAGIARDPSVLPAVDVISEEDWTAYLEDRKRALTELAVAFRSGDARLDPKKGHTCDRCDVSALCRVKEAAVVAGDV